MSVLPIAHCLWTFPISLRDPDTMEVLGYTTTETLLWDYSEVEEYHVLVRPPARRVRTLYRVPWSYAYHWFHLFGGTDLRIIYYPFAKVRFGDVPEPTCDAEIIEIFASITVSPSSVGEDNEDLIYTVTLDSASAFDTEITYSVSGTATQGVDYTAAFINPIVILAGQTTGTITVTSSEDLLTEDSETVIVTLLSGTSGTNIITISTTNASAIGTIIDTTPFQVTWDPLSIENVVLSNGNLTNTNTGIYNDNFDPQGAKVTGVLSTGKYYFEVTFDSQNVGFSDMALGIGSAGGNYSGFHYASGAYGAVLYGRSFNIYMDSQYSGKSLTGPVDNADGDVFGIAVDLDSSKVWFQVVAGPDVDLVNGWNGNNGDPVLGTGGITIPTGLKSIFGAYSDEDNTEALTLNFGLSPFSGTTPTGYTPGWPSHAFVPVVTGATWGSATATNVTLSNSDLTATNDLDGPGNPGGVLGTVARGDSARYYFEVTCTQPSTTGSSTYYFGFGSSIQVGSGVGVDRVGNLRVNFSTTGDGLGPLQAGDVVGVAFDLINNKAWLGIVAGPSYPTFSPWIGQSFASYPPISPGANTWGVAPAGGPHKPLVAWGSTDNTQSITFNLAGPFVGNPGVTWNAPFSSFSGTATRSNGNLTVTATNANPVAVMSSGAHYNGPPSPSTGSYWFEITAGATYAGTNTGCGICLYLFDPYLNIVLGKGAFSFLVDAAGDCWYRPVYFTGPGTTGISLGAILPGDVLQFAVTISAASRIWVRINRGGVAQNWNANPAASPFPAVGGFDISVLFNVADNLNAASVFQAFANNGSSSTVNFGQTTFVTNPPIFGPWSNSFAPWTGTLDPLNKIYTTLSNGDLTATNAYPPIAEQGVTVVTASGKTSGKYYFEVTITIDMDDDANMGVAVVGTDYLQFNLHATGGVAVWVYGDILADGVDTGYSLNLDQVDRVGVAVDLDNRKVWVKTVDGSDYYQPNDWNGLNIGDADPATNLNGIPLVAGTIVPIVTFSGNSGDDAGNSLTINTGQSPFAGLTPVGFTAGWPA